MTTMQERARAAFANQEVLPTPTMAPYHAALKEFADAIEQAVDREVGTVVRRTSSGAGWEVLAWPRYQTKNRRSLIAAYPAYNGILVYNQNLSTPAEFERFLLEMIAEPTLIETVQDLRALVNANVDGWVVPSDVPEQERRAFYLVAENTGFKRLAEDSTGKTVDVKVRVEAHRSNHGVPQPTREQRLEGDFAGQQFSEAYLDENTNAATSADWPMLLRCKRGPTPRRPYATR